MCAEPGRRARPAQGLFLVIEFLRQFLEFREPLAALASSLRRLHAFGDVQDVTQSLRIRESQRRRRDLRHGRLRLRSVCVDQDDDKTYLSRLTSLVFERFERSSHHHRRSWSATRDA